MKHLVLLSLLSVTCCNELIHVKSEVDESEAGVEEAEISNDDVFVATDEWQEIKPGQAIPRGLHVRMDMQTGKKEAKIMSAGDKSVKEETTPDPYEALKEAMKNIKEDFKASKESEPNVDTKFRSMTQLKDELSELDMNIKTEYEIMNDLVGKFKDSASDIDKADILEDLEYYVHKIDNALDFLQLGGLSSILKPSLNSSTASLRRMSCHLLGGAAQSNPHFQKASLESGVIGIVLRLVTLDADIEVSIKALYALSALLRNFPEAQIDFMRQGGLSVLTSMFDKEGKQFNKLQIKLLTLLHDLLVERQNTNPVVMKSYAAVDLAAQLSSSGWCKVLNKVLVIPKSDRAARREDILSTMRDDIPVRVEHDSVEKILEAMILMLPTCSQDFSVDSELREKLSFLGSHYSLLSDKERAEGEDDLFFSSLFNKIHTITSSFHKHEL